MVKHTGQSTGTNAGTNKLTNNNRDLLLAFDDTDNLTENTW